MYPQEIRLVRVRPGGRVNLVFTERGYTSSPIGVRGRIELLAARIGISALVGFLVFLPAPYLLDRLGAPDPYQDAALWAVGACMLCLLLIGLGLAAREWAEVLGCLARVPFMVLFAIATAPLLLFPRPRRWLRESKERRRRREPEPGGTRGSAPLTPPEWITHTSVRTRGRKGRGVTVTVRFVNGETVAYTASGDDGRRLRAEFTRLLGDRVAHDLV